MKVKMLLVSAISIGSIFFALIGCSDDDKAVPTATVNANGLVVNEMSSVMGSIATLSFMSHGFETFGGVPTSYCNANGQPIIGGVALTDADTEFPSATGYCQATYNAQSPDTARGAMYIAGGMVCAASYAGLFDNLATGGTNSGTISITFNTNCWGSQAEVDALIADAGAEGFDDVAASVEEVSGSTAFNYKITYTIPGEGAEVVYIKNENGVKAALHTGSPWYVMMNTTNGTLIYEGIDTDNERRVRLLLDGTISNSAFSTLDSIDGLFLQSTGGTWTTFASYTGNPSDGLKGNLLSNGGTDQSDECYWPGSAAACGGLTSIPLVGGQEAAMNAAFATAAANLAAATGTLADFATIDPGDTDITQ